MVQIRLTERLGEGDYKGRIIIDGRQGYCSTYVSASKNFKWSREDRYDRDEVFRMRINQKWFKDYPLIILELSIIISKYQPNKYNIPLLQKRTNQRNYRQVIQGQVIGSISTCSSKKSRKSSQNLNIWSRSWSKSNYISTLQQARKVSHSAAQSDHASKAPSKRQWASSSSTRKPREILWVHSQEIQVLLLHDQLRALQNANDSYNLGYS